MSSSDLAPTPGTTCPVERIDITCPVEKIAGLADAFATLRSKDVLHSAAIWSAAHRDPTPEALTCLREYTDNVITFANGESHRGRRRLLNQLVRPEAIDVIRDTIVLPRSRELLQRLATGPDAEGRYRFDLVTFCERVFLHFSAKFIGFVGTETDEQMERLRGCVGPLSGAVASAFYKDRAGILAAAAEAKARYIEEFYLPSLAAARAALADRPADESGAVEPPRNFMEIVASGVHAEWDDEALAIRDSVLLFSASVGSSTQTIVNAVAGLTTWFAEHPEDYEQSTDYNFLLDAIQEALRLNSPFSPYVTRVAAREAVVGEHTLAEGQEIHVYLPTAGQDPSVWGPDAAAFNPRRPTPEGWNRHGIAFSAGPHQCLGQRVVLGSDGTGGAHVRVLQTLYRAGVQPDPDSPPKSIERVVREQPDPFEVDLKRWTSYPVVLDDLDPTDS
ncbi:cytochrome P450 [Sporichthya sp.]|uniref:cytochrome P450 n=1 Tax=Sporichthya sp. TaxID=65475 RepID=UPI0017FCB55A|nr:cytochrome P450 [Sporichthya sp.]MBA3741437.1 cytochrome P450 [Sporichthya sp.]